MGLKDDVLMFLDNRTLFPTTTDERRATDGGLDLLWRWFRNIPRKSLDIKQSFKCSPQNCTIQNGDTLEIHYHSYLVDSIATFISNYNINGHPGWPPPLLHRDNSISARLDLDVKVYFGSPPPPCKITSETVAASPENRQRTTIGVGEDVTLTFSGDNASWTLNGTTGQSLAQAARGGQLSTYSGKETTYSADERKTVASIVARDVNSGCQASIFFDVIEPSGVVLGLSDDKTLAPVRHTRGKPDLGFVGSVYIAPDTVSFQNISVREVNVGATATGVYSPANGSGHIPSGRDFSNPHPVGSRVVPGLGSKVQGKGLVDEVYCCCIKWAEPFEPGRIIWNIPWQYQVGSGGAYYEFAKVPEVIVLETNRNIITASKGGRVVRGNVSDPTSSYADAIQCGLSP